MKTQTAANTVYWGNWGITFSQNEKILGTLYFPVGPQGPQDGTIGSKLNLKFREACRAWTEEGILPVNITAVPA